ncbi:MAG: 4Fe-4S dicluster domain-containing protein, partial [Halobacteriaceae archaeon]
MSDADGGASDGAPDGDEFEPIEVFPEMGADPEEGPDLRPASDSCYKCSTCDTVCPVAAVDDDFPGPKFQGPEQWRLKRSGDEVDDSITKCSNCMRCDDAC